MPDKCVAPGCTSNYESAVKKEGYVQIFRFPKDEKLRSEWIRAIPRSNWNPPQRAYVCIKHFHKTDLVWSEKFKNRDGEWCEFKRDKPVLSPCAVPKLFPKSPQYHTNKCPAPKRSDPEERRLNYKRKLKKEERLKRIEEEDKICDYTTFSEALSSKIKGNPSLINLSHDELYKSGKVCDVHFHESDILPSGRLQHNAIPMPYIPIKEEHASPPRSPPSPDPHPSWRSQPTLRTYSSANAENAEEKQKQQMLRNIELSYPPVDSQFLTEDSNPSQTSESEPIASTSKLATLTSATVKPATVTSATVTSQVSQPKSLIQKSTVAEFSVIKKSTVDETAKLRETIKRLEEKNIQLQVENESYRVKNIMLETKQKKLIVQLKTIIQKKDPLYLGDSRLVYEQHSQRLTVSSASTTGSRTTTTLAGQGHDSDVGATQSQDFSDPDDPTDNTAFMDSLQPSDIDIDVGPIFETIEIKPNIELDNLPPPPPSPPPKRKRTAIPDIEVAEQEDPLATKRTRSSPLVGYGEDGDKEDDDNFSGDEFDEEEDGDKVRRAYQLLKSVFDKKDKYDIFGHRLAARLRALKSAKVCRHVLDIMESVIDDAEAGKYNNV
ncbi:uncharacterized protein LOC111046939 isoform X3 [Nilaparvata lugens]|uniref:uncharacterized protein LOC111046939 isoform X3 n=1 Tax=Nilaparvata lugens TaxID=108931 RepID=UPI00193D10DA|nr:uncharacterized protein LOC111046939 isoform X3 [Nilaparvata lugens]